MLAPVRGRLRVGQVPRIELDDHRPSLPKLLDEMLGQRPVELHLVDVDAEQPLEVLPFRLEERPLVALEVGADSAAERRERLVPARVHELDQDVRVAVGLRIVTIRVV